MPIFESQSIQTVAVHRVGNKETAEGLILSGETLSLNESLQDLLVRYFLTPFKVEEYYHLYDDDNVELNEVFHRVSNIFDDPTTLLEESQQIARHLYNACNHPNIKGGDLFVVYFSECQLNGETMDAVGLFKSETKEQFLKVLHDEEQWNRQENDPSAQAAFKLEIDKGINVNKLDKGAIIFNSEREQGFIVSVVDATNRGTDAAYWKDAFLHIRQREDEFFNTHEVMKAYKQFVTDEFPQQFADVSKADCAEMLNRGAKFFKQNDNFDMEQFTQEVISQPEIIDSFQQYKQQYEQENDVQLPDQFGISEGAVKKESRAYKSVIKLDKNFHIYVHGNRELIEQGEDEKGKFYKVYYSEES